MLFILFNGGNVMDNQWIEFKGTKSNIISKLKNFGEVYTYAPKFYFDDNKIDDFIKSNNKSLFELKDLNIEEHCKYLYNKIKHIDDVYFLISHSRGYIYAHAFGNMYQNKIVGYINIDGGKPLIEIELRCQNIENKYKLVQKINEEQLNNLFNTLRQNIEQKSTIKILLANLVEYYQYKQHNKTHIQFNFPVHILNNIYNDNDINLSTSGYIETTLSWKIQFNKELESKKNIKSSWYVGKTHWLYTDDTVVSDMMKIITDMMGTSDLNNKKIYIIRHGETEWNKLGLTQGSRNDIELTENGKKQAHSIANYLNEHINKNEENFDLIISSPMIRTKQTTKIICNTINYNEKNVVYMDDLTEVDQGLIAIGKSTNELKADPFYNDFFALMEPYNKLDIIQQHELEDDLPEIFTTKYQLESLEHLANRVKRVIEYIKKSKHKKIIIVTHNGTINMINKIILNSVDEIKGNLSKGKNCYLTYYKLEKNKFKLILAPSTFFL